MHFSKWKPFFLTQLISTWINLAVTDEQNQVFPFVSCQHCTGSRLRCLTFILCICDDFPFALLGYILKSQGEKRRWENIFLDYEESPRWILGCLKGSHRCTSVVGYQQLTNDVEMKQSVQIRGENYFLIDTIYTNWSETNNLHTEGVLKRLEFTVWFIHYRFW